MTISADVCQYYCGAIGFDDSPFRCNRRSPLLAGYFTVVRSPCWIGKRPGCHRLGKDVASFNAWITLPTSRNTYGLPQRRLARQHIPWRRYQSSLNKYRFSVTTDSGNAAPPSSYSAALSVTTCTSLTWNNLFIRQCLPVPGFPVPPLAWYVHGNTSFTTANRKSVPLRVTAD